MLLWLENLNKRAMSSFLDVIGTRKCNPIAPSLIHATLHLRKSLNLFIFKSTSSPILRVRFARILAPVSEISLTEHSVERLLSS